MDILKRVQLEQRKEVLKAAKEKIKISGIDIATPRGVINVNNKIVISEVLRVIDAEIEDINIKIEEITGLNVDRLDYLNEVGVRQ